MIAKCYTIPLACEAHSFGIALGGQEYRLTVRWMDAPMGGWLIDVQQADNATPLIMGLPLVAGCDLLEPFQYMEFGGGLWLDSVLPATPENLGTGVPLVFVVGTLHNAQLDSFLAAHRLAKAAKGMAIASEYAMYSVHMQHVHAESDAKRHEAQAQFDNTLLLACGQLHHIVHNEMPGITCVG